MNKLNKKGGLYGQVQELSQNMDSLKRSQNSMKDDVDELYEENDYPAVKNTGKQSFTIQKEGENFYFVDRDRKRYKISVTAE